MEYEAQTLTNVYYCVYYSSTNYYFSRVSEEKVHMKCKTIYNQQTSGLLYLAATRYVAANSGEIKKKSHSLEPFSLPLQWSL